MPFDECVFKCTPPLYVPRTRIHQYLIQYRKAGHVGYRPVKTNAKHRQISDTNLHESYHLNHKMFRIIQIICIFEHVNEDFQH